MSRSRVFILYSHGLFARGVQSLLAREQEVEVVGVEKDDRQALGRIKELGPDVILLDSSLQRGERCAPIAEIFQQAPSARVISLSLQENGVDVYDKHRIVACGPVELLHAIRRDEEMARHGDGETRRRAKGKGRPEAQDLQPTTQNSELRIG